MLKSEATGTPPGKRTVRERCGTRAPALAEAVTGRKKNDKRTANRSLFVGRAKRLTAS